MSAYKAIRIQKKGIYLLCIKYPNVLPPESICVPSRVVRLHSVCHEDDKVEYNSGRLKKKKKKGSSKVHNGAGSFKSGREEGGGGIPVLKYFLSAISKIKGLSFNQIYPSCCGPGREGVVGQGGERFTFSYEFVSKQKWHIQMFLDLFYSCSDTRIKIHGPPSVCSC